MRSLAESGAKKAMEMKLRKTGLPRRLPEQDPRLIFVGQQVASTTEPAEGVVMKERRHGEIILPRRE